MVFILDSVGAANTHRARTTNNTSKRKGFAANVAGGCVPIAPASPLRRFRASCRGCNVATLRMDQQRGKVVLVEFWDFCRVNSLRTLPYLKAWHERYADAGLRIIRRAHRRLPPRRVEENVRRAVERLEIRGRSSSTQQLEVWDDYGNEGWPARYLWTPEDSAAVLHALRRRRVRGDRARDPGAAWAFPATSLAPVHPEDAEDALNRAADAGSARTRTRAPTTRPEACGPSSTAWARCSVNGWDRVQRGARQRSSLCTTSGHTARRSSCSRVTEGVEVHATCFTPALTAA